MTTAATQAAEAAAAPDEGVTLAPAVVAEYESLLARVPDAGGSGMDGMLEAIARATRPEDLDQPWRSSGLEPFIGHRLRIQAIRKMPSDFEGGIPWYLVLEAVDMATGELVTITTGAVMVVAQLVKAYSLKALPITVIPVAARKATPGRRPPVHLDIVV